MCPEGYTRFLILKTNDFYIHCTQLNTLQHVLKCLLLIVVKGW